MDINKIVIKVFRKRIINGIPCYTINSKGITSTNEVIDLSCCFIDTKDCSTKSYTNCNLFNYRSNDLETDLNNTKCKTEYKLKPMEFIYYCDR